MGFEINFPQFLCSKKIIILEVRLFKIFWVLD